MEQEKTLGEPSESPIYEVWKPIIGYEDFYEISNLGRIRSVSRVLKYKNQKRYYQSRMLKQRKSNMGYMMVDLTLDKKHTLSVHRLVALHFCENPNNYPVVNHIDNNKENNSASNLEWCTQSYNIQYAYDNGTKTPPNQKPVSQYLVDGSYIATYKSIAEAEKATGALKQNIYKVCTHQRKKAGGYVWKYAL